MRAAPVLPLTALVLALGPVAAGAAPATPQRPVSRPSLASLTVAGHLPDGYGVTRLRTLRAPASDTTTCTSITLAPKGSSVAEAGLTELAKRATGRRAEEVLVRLSSSAQARKIYDAFVARARACRTYAETDGSHTTLTTSRGPFSGSTRSELISQRGKGFEVHEIISTQGRYVFVVNGLAGSGTSVRGLTKAEVTAFARDAKTALGGQR